MAQKRRTLILAVLVILLIYTVHTIHPAAYVPNFLHTFASRTKIHKIIVLDSWGPAHEEVVAPVLWNLHQIPRVEVSVYRNHYRSDFPDLLHGWFRGTLNNYTEFWNLDLADVDTVFLTTSDRDLEKLMVRHKTLQRYPHLRVVGITHQMQHWNAKSIPKDSHQVDRRYPFSRKGLEKVAQLANTGRMSMITLSSHVKTCLEETLYRNPVPHFKDSIDIEVFVPVMPIPWVTEKLEITGNIKRASVLGKLNPDSRTYDLIFRELTHRKAEQPKRWAVDTKTKYDENGQIVSETADPSFVLSLIGRTTADIAPLHVPRNITAHVEQHKDPGHAKLYTELARSDIVLPAFAKREFYTTKAASGAIPAALMVRVPVLIDAGELEAYSYLRPPAYILKRPGESDMDAIARLRKAHKPNQRPKDLSAEWEAYMSQLYRDNKRTLRHVLRLDG